MHAKSGLRVFLKWKIYRPDSVIAAVIPLNQMKYRIQTLFLLLLAVAICVTVWQRYDAHAKRWAGYTAKSIPKAKWSKTSNAYRSASRNGFKCLEELDAKFVDFRYWDFANAQYCTCWRIPYSKQALTDHINEFHLALTDMTPGISFELKSCLPADWRFKKHKNMKVYEPKNQRGDLSFFFVLVVHDTESRVIYFCEMDRAVPA